MAMGRHPKRTVLVEIGRLRPFSDVGGRHVLRLDSSSQRRQDLAERLRTAGCSVDLSGRDWHKVGSFHLEQPAGASQNAPTPPNALSAEAITVLKFLESREHNVKAEMVADELGIETGRVSYILMKLRKEAYVYEVLTGFQIDDKGREALHGPV